VVHGAGPFAELAPPLPPASPDWSPGISPARPGARRRVAGARCGRARGAGARAARARVRPGPRCSRTRLDWRRTRRHGPARLLGGRRRLLRLRRRPPPIASPRDAVRVPPPPRALRIRRPVPAHDRPDRAPLPRPTAVAPVAASPRPRTDARRARCVRFATRHDLAGPTCAAMGQPCSGGCLGVGGSRSSATQSRRIATEGGMHFRRGLPPPFG
jgi:hypothetical protein